MLDWDDLPAYHVSSLPDWDVPVWGAFLVDLEPTAEGAWIAAGRFDGLDIVQVVGGEVAVEHTTLLEGSWLSGDIAIVDGILWVAVVFRETVRFEGGELTSAGGSTDGDLLLAKVRASDGVLLGWWQLSGHADVETVRIAAQEAGIAVVSVYRSAPAGFPEWGRAGFGPRIQAVHVMRLLGDGTIVWAEHIRTTSARCVRTAIDGSILAVTGITHESFLLQAQWFNPAADANRFRVDFALGNGAARLSRLDRDARDHPLVWSPHVSVGVSRSGEDVCMVESVALDKDVAVVASMTPQRPVFSLPDDTRVLELTMVGRDSEREEVVLPDRVACASDHPRSRPALFLVGAPGLVTVIVACGSLTRGILRLQRVRVALD